MVSRALVCLALVAVAACNGDQAVNQPVDVTAVSSWGFTNGEVKLISASFVGADTTPSVFAGTDELDVRALGPESIAVRLPASPGPINLTVQLSTGASTSVPGISVIGYLGYSRGPGMNGRLAAIAGLGPLTAVGVDANRRLAVLDLQTLTSVPLGSASDTGWGSCVAGLVASAQDPAVASLARASGGTCKAVAVSLTTPLTIVDTAGSVGQGWSTLWLGQSRWIRGQKDFISVSAPGVAYDSACAQTEDFLVVRSKQVAMPVHCLRRVGAAGIPVFDVTNSQVRYSLPLYAAHAAAPSPGEDTLYTMGELYGDTVQTLFAFRAADGTLLDSQRLDLPRVLVTTGMAMVTDPAGPWIYLATEKPSGTTHDHPVIQVYDRRTLKLVGEMQAPDSVLNNNMVYWSLFVGGNRQLYLAATSFLGTGIALDPVAVFRFQLPAAQP